MPCIPLRDVAGLHRIELTVTLQEIEELRQREQQQLQSHTADDDD